MCCCLNPKHVSLCFVKLNSRAFRIFPDESCYVWQKFSFNCHAKISTGMFKILLDACFNNNDRLSLLDLNAYIIYKKHLPSVTMIIRIVLCLFFPISETPYIYIVSYSFVVIISLVSHRNCSLFSILQKIAKENFRINFILKNINLTFIGAKWLEKYHDPFQKELVDGWLETSPILDASLLLVLINAIELWFNINDICMFMRTK